MDSKRTTLIIGGARSGKSRLAQQIAESSNPQRTFIATAEALDDEMEARISKHVSDRGKSWGTIEAPIQLCEAIQETCDANKAVLVDCLTLWLSNIMHKELDVGHEISRLVETVSSISSPLVLVSNEVGLGLVPQTPLGREFRDQQGRLNQAMARVCSEVRFIAAGLPLTLKSSSSSQVSHPIGMG